MNERNDTPLHITSGDCAGDILVKSAVTGEIFVWHDILYDGPRNVGWPDEHTLHARAQFLEDVTGGGMAKEHILTTLKGQYEKLAEAKGYQQIVLWFDACLFDQSMLAHILSCLQLCGMTERVELLCVDNFPGIEPFNGLGQLDPVQMASLFEKRCSVTTSQFVFAEKVDKAFAEQDLSTLVELSETINAPLPWVPAAVARWLLEQPGKGLGRLETLALEAIREGCETPGQIFSAVAAKDSPPQFWGDIILWATINGLAKRNPPLVRIDGPSQFLPQWNGGDKLKQFRISAVSDRGVNG